MGLGNPGTRYAATRHNAGQRVVEELARRWDMGRGASRYRGTFWQGRGPAGPVALLVPETFMNESGASVGPAMGAMRLTPAQVLVVHDEIDIPFGEVRGKSGGGHGGHNGLRSVTSGLGSNAFARVRVGVGRPGPDFGGDEAAWVLARFDEQPAQVAELIERAADMTQLAVADGIDAAIARYHAKPHGESARARAQRRSDAAASQPPAESEQ